MHDQHQTNHPPDELTQGFWQAWREQVGKSPRLRHLLLQRSRQLLERLQHFYDMLSKLSLAGQQRWQRKLGTSLAGVALALALSNAPVAHAFPGGGDNASLNGGAACDLFGAITAANTNTDVGGCGAGLPGADTITLLQDVTLNAPAGAYGLPGISSEITIEGAGFTIARDTGATDTFRVLGVVTGGNLTLNDTTISGGTGGLSILFGTLTLNNSTVSGNTTISTDNGGGITNVFGTLTLNNSTVSANTAAGGGGGITSLSGTLTLNNSTVSANTSNGRGGGISSQGDTVILNNSTVSGNTGSGGGGLSNQSTMTLNNSTVSGNTATNTGGAIYNLGALTLERSLISGNTASNAQEIYSPPPCLSASSVDAPDCLVSTSAVNSVDGNLFGHSGLTNAQAFYGFTPAASDITATSDGTTPTALAAILDTTLADNGGGTETHALVAGSPAVDAVTSGPATDQRGVSRPQGADYDIGAYELEQANNQPPVANAGPDQSVFRNDVVNVSGSWTDPEGAGDNPYTWSWDLDGDAIPDDSGSANYGDTIPGSTSFAVNGVATLTFSVTDKNGATSSDTVDITVVNRAPTANGQSVSTNEDTPLPITLTGGDADGDSLVYTVLTLPANGTLTGSPPNLTYTPAPDSFGGDSFTFQVNDGLDDSNVATVSINVNAVNDPAVALDDSAMTDEDTAVTIPVQGNDSAGPANENQSLTTTAVSDPPNGSAVINPDGSVTYTPDANFNGSDGFTYTVCDSDNACATATVTVLVEMVNDPPVAGDDSVTTPEDTWANFNVLANDSDVDGNLDPASVSVLTSPIHGTLQDHGNGSFTYIPAANYNGADSFTYQVCDTDGICVDATVTITVTPVNDAPVCTGAAPSVAELWPPNHQFEPVTVNGATDIEGDPITISIYSIYQDEPVDGTGDGDTAPDGDGIGTSTAQVRAERKGNGNGRFYYIAFQATDGNGGSCIATVKVSVPKNQGKKGAAVDDGPLYDSTQVTSSASEQRSNQRFLPLVTQ